MRRKTLAEKHELRIAKKDYKISQKMDEHQSGRQELIKAIADGLGSCNLPALKVKVGNIVVFASH